MIQEIENRSEYGYFTISYNDVSLGCFPDSKEIIKFNDNGKGGSQKGIDHFSKEQLKDFALTILQGYIFSHKEMAMMINDAVSEQDLMNQKRLILLIRDVLETLSIFIEEYESKILDPYRE